jgi:hypothetical protein
MPKAALGMVAKANLNTPTRQIASQTRFQGDLQRGLNMALTATQGVMAVGLLSVLFGADLLTLLGSKVRHKSCLSCSPVLRSRKQIHRER